VAGDVKVIFYFLMYFPSLNFEMIVGCVPKNRLVRFYVQRYYIRSKRSRISNTCLLVCCSWWRTGLWPSKDTSVDDLLGGVQF
jgi:hypothetical protein